MYKTINGFTKAKMIRMIKKNNKGVPSRGRIKWGEGSSVTYFVGCAYRGKNSNACAVGCFIPDELYTPAMENKTPNMLLSSHPELQEVLPLNSSGLTTLQDIHDNTDDDKDPRPAMIKWIKKNVKDSK